jgi:PPOX class probable F420-dependent enzyme
MPEIPEAYRDLFETDAFAHLATVMPDGTPHVTPVWIDYDGEYVLVNTARGRQKVANVERNPKVGLTVMGPDDPYRYVQVRGEVETVTEDGAVEHIDELAGRYMGVEEYPNLGNEEGARVMIEIRPDRVVTGG